MPIADLLKDKVVRDSASKDAVDGLTKDFVGRWARHQIDLQPSLTDKDHPNDLTPAGTTAVRPKLAVDLPKVLPVYTEIAKRVAADTRQLDLDWNAIGKRVESRPPQVDPRAMRKVLVATIVYEAVAVDPTLAEPAGLERLHRICDRRLRIVERMLYDVGRAEKLRRWNANQIATHKGGPWVDGLERMFEYPRVPQEFFRAPCNPNATTGFCQPPMADWRLLGVENLLTQERTNPTTTAAWFPNPSNKTSLEYQPGVLADAIEAVEKLFAPSTDYRSRNLLFCDQVIHSLHLEALIFSVMKRQADRTWLDTERTAKGPGWLRLYAPFSQIATFLGGRLEPAHFEFVPARVADLQPGDHLIIYNHPAYEHVTTSGVWKLENAIVVQSHPELRMQGHGSNIRDKDGMWRDMLGLFNRELDRRRADVDGYATVTADLLKQVRVDTVKQLRVGMRVDIADPATDAVSAPNRAITAIDAAQGLVTYDGDDAVTKPGQVLRHPRFVDAAGLEQILVEGVFIGRRVAAASSKYAGRNRRADWQVLWHGNPQETALRNDEKRRKFALEHQLVDYQPNPFTGKPDETVGWFPLWTAATDGAPDKPRLDAAGKIAATQKVVIEAKHIGGWTFFLNPDPARQDIAAVIRPREA